MAQINLKQIKGLTAGSILFLDSEKVTENNSKLFWDNQNNRLGIGTTTPTFKLDVSDSNRSIAIFRTTNALADLYLRASGTGSDGKVGIRASGDNLVLISNGSVKASFKSDNFGIGTTNPIETLDVIGNIKADGILKLYDVTDTQTIELNPDGNSYINGGNVGIGTTNPTSLLEVNGLGTFNNVNINQSIFVNNTIQKLNNTGTGITFNSDNISFTTGNFNKRLEIGPSDNFAIQVNPKNFPWFLGVYTTDDTDYTSLINGSQFGSLITGTNNGHVVLTLRNNDNSDSFAILSNSNNDTTSPPNQVLFRVRANAPSYISNSLGIGVTNAIEKLDVDGNIKADGILKLYDITDTQQIELNPDGDSYIKTKLAIGRPFNETPQAVLHIKDVNPRIIRLQDINYTNVYADIDFKDGSLKFLTDPQQIRDNSLISFSIDNLERMRIKDDGNVGIGTTNPTKNLHITDTEFTTIKLSSDTTGNTENDGTDLFLSGIDFVIHNRENGNIRFFTNLTERFKITNNGDIGIGIGSNNPTEKLDVNGNIKADGILKLFDITDTQKIELNPNGDSYILNGNIGIGTSNPERNLHVADDVRIDSDLFVRTISSQYFSSSNNLNLIYGDAANFNIYSNTTERFRITSDGNVGIGTTTPNDKLDIDGDIRVKRTNRKPTHEDVLTSDFVSVGSVSFYTDDWIKVKVIGRGDSGVNKSFAEYLIYYDGANYNIELLNNIVIGDNSGFPLLRMNGSNLEIKNRDSVNVGNYLIYFDDFISQTLFSGKTYRVEDFPLIWINDLYYNTYKDNTFVPNQNISIPNQSDYDTVTSILVNIKSLTTDFTGTLLGKFNNLSNLQCVSNQISVLDVSQNTNLTQLICYDNQIQTLDVSQLVNLNRLSCQINQIQTLDVSQLVNLNNLECKSNQLDAATNSQILIDLDTNGQSNGILNSSIFGGGFITPTGIDSFNSLLSKGWNIVGLTNQISAGTTYNVEDFPKIWIDDLYYNTYKGDTFVPSINTLMTGQTEYDTVTLIDLASQSLTTDFTNTLLGKFTNLEDIYIANNSISVLDVSNLTQVQEISCHGNLISVLDVANLLNLTYIHCGGNSISVLDVSNLTNLRLLYCYSNPISVLDVSNLTNLAAIHCGNVPISVLDVANLTQLTQLYCYSNSVSVLNVVNLIELTTLHIHYTQIDFLDFTNLTKLNNFNGFGARLNSTVNSQLLVDLDGHGLSNGYFQSSIFGGDYLTPLGVESAISLNSKNWNIVGLTYVLQTGTSYDIEDFPLAWIEENNFATYSGNTFQVVSDRNMPTQTEYDAVTIINLNSLSLTTNFTNTLLKKFSNLQELKVNNNSIQVLDPSELYELIVLDCHNNSIEVLDVSQLTELTTLYCYINQIEVLDTTNLTKLVNLVCYTNQIQVLDTSQLVDLLVIDCQYNQIQVLDISNSLDLNFLRCNNNQIQVLAISQLTKLTYIDCNSNQIQSLDVSQLNLLTTFYCHNNLLTSLDISQNVNLVNLTCYANQLNNLVNSQILIDLDTNGLSNGYLNSSIFGGGSLPHEGVSSGLNLLDKNWTVVGLPLNYLLNDYSGAAAAYSLYRLNTAYTGPAITVRRDSDNSVQNIGFVNGILDTAALTTFCNTPVTTYTSDFSVSENFFELDGTGTINESIGGVNDAYKFELSNGLTTAHQARLIALQVNANFTVTFDYYIPSTNNSVNGIVIKSGSGGNVFTNFQTVVDNWTSVSLTFDAPETVLRFIAASGGITNIDADGDVFYLKNIVVTQNSSNGLVSKWYDQSGNGFDATQTVATNQPKIFDSVTGVVEINGKPSIDFSGTAHLETVDTGIDALIEQIQIVAYNKSQVTPTSSLQQLLNTYGSEGFEGLAFGASTVSLANETFTILNDAAAREAITDIINIGSHLFTIDWNGSQHNIYLDSNTGSFISVNTPIQLNSRQLAIGRRLTGISFDFGGQIQEIILYASDQSTNRVAIQDNINDRYELYWNGATQRLLDTYTGATAAYSLEAINANYTGNIIQVRRDSDNAVLNIGANYDGSLDVDKLTNFCTGANGFVTRWYDQSGNGYDASNALASGQPKIFDSVNGIVLENGKPAMAYGSSIYLRSTFSSPIYPLTGFITFRGQVGRFIFDDNNDVNTNSLFLLNSTDIRFYNDSGKNIVHTISDSWNNQHLASFIADDTNSLIGIDSDFTTGTMGVDSLSGITLGNVATGTLGMNGTIQEAIIYPTNQNTNRVAIEDNINNRYFIYLKPLTTYNVEDYPLIWINGLYYNTFKDDTFEVSAVTNNTTQTEYDSVTSIFLDNKSLTTDFTDTLLNKFDNLTYLNCINNQITTLAVSQLVNLEYLYCSNNQIATLDVSQLVSLIKLYCDNNQIATLDVSQLTSLTDLRPFNNQISILDVSQLTSLTILYCYGNQISVLDVPQLVNLIDLNCHNNQISVLDVSQLVNLQYLFCDDNQITTLDVSQLVNLIMLRCFNNQISVLDVSQLTSLTFINCVNNQISILDVSQLVNLDKLYCSYNQIATLDVSQLVNLIELSCTNNQISTLDVSQLVNLNNLQCQNNQLDAATNSQILVDLDNNGLSNGYFISSIFGGGTLTAAGQTAKTNLLSKGWTIVGI